MNFKEEATGLLEIHNKFMEFRKDQFATCTFCNEKGFPQTNFHSPNCWLQRVIKVLDEIVK